MSALIRAKAKAVAGIVLVVSMVAGVFATVIAAEVETGSVRTVKPIGKEALIEFPKVALWSSVANFRPGDGENVDINPPRFSWSYTPNPSDAAKDISAKEFQLQVAYDKDLKELAVDVHTPSNTYNFIAPFKKKTCYWRVGYINPEKGKEPFAWSKVRRFTIAEDAVEWDRGMLADEKYLAEKGKHPHMLFNAGNREALNKYLEANGGKTWSALKDVANKAIVAPWWPDSNPSGYEGNWVGHVAIVSLVWQMTRDPKYLNAKPQRALLYLARHYIKAKGPMADYIYDHRFFDMHRALAFGYDWLYEVMTPEERQEVLRAIELRCLYITKNGVWYDSKNPKFAWGKGDATGEYAGGSVVRPSSLFKGGSSHSIDNFHWTVQSGLSCYAESKACRELFDLSLNYMLGTSYCFGFDGTANNGRGYSSLHLFHGTGNGLFEHILSQTVFPEAKFNLNPFWRNSADWWDWTMPVGFVQGYEPWGDTGWGLFAPWRMNSFGRNLALFTGSGRAMKHWQEELSLVRGSQYTYKYHELPIPFHFRAPAMEETDTRARIFPQGGWAMGATYPPNTKASFRDGVGFVFQARPGGSTGGHDHLSDLSFQIWAYGTTITDAAAGMYQAPAASYAKIPMSHYSILVNGLGQAQPMGAPMESYYSRFFAFQDSKDYTYVAADGTNAYPRKPFNVSGWLLPKDFSRLHSGGPLSFLTKVRRHILFVHKKYFVIFDDLEADKPAKFTWLYHVLEDTLKLDTADASFQYTSNIAKYLVDQNQKSARLLQPYTEGTADVRVYVKHIVRPQDLEVLDLSGDKVRSNPITGENYYNQTNPYIRAHALWISNKTPATKFHFMSVVYPVKPGTSAPEIKRLDDFTVEVTCGSEKDVISFDPQTRHPATMVIDLPAMTPLPVAE